jgi:hypothetical protein
MNAVTTRMPPIVMANPIATNHQCPLSPATVPGSRACRTLCHSDSSRPRFL